MRSGVLVLVAGLALAVQPARSLPFQENLGNFPDAIEVSAEFDTFSGLQVNGETISATGFLFTVTNTSFGDGGHSSFEADPDGDFAVGDVLTAAAGTALDAAQPFGLFAFGAGLPLGAGAIVSAPSGFILDIEGVMFADLVEINFSVWLAMPMVGPDGLLFDSDAPTLPSIFTSPRTGSVQFFISTPAGFTISPGEGIDIASQMAWEVGGGVATTFAAPGQTFDDTRLRPRGQLTAIPEPGTAALLAGALVALALQRISGWPLRLPAAGSRRRGYPARTRRSPGRSADRTD